ncbi:putative radial spoke 3-like protein [Sesbania bispinosa]|nr:putative radial spoke 3-like protein [Sesbania bispinosa]
MENLPEVLRCSRWGESLGFTTESSQCSRFAVESSHGLGRTTGEKSTSCLGASRRSSHDAAHGVSPCPHVGVRRSSCAHMVGEEGGGWCGVGWWLLQLGLAGGGGSSSST